MDPQHPGPKGLQDQLRAWGWWDPRAPRRREQWVAGLGNVCPEGVLLFLPFCLPSLFDPLVLGGGNHRGEGTHRAGGSLPGLQTAWTPGGGARPPWQVPTSHACPPLHPVPAPASREDEPRDWREMPRWSPATWTHELLMPPPSVSFPAKLQTPRAGRTREAGRSCFYICIYIYRYIN